MVRRTVLAGFIILLLGYLASSAAFAQGPEPKLTLGFEKEGTVGSDIVLAVYLDDPAGNPIRGEQITFYIDAAFMNSSNDIKLGIVKTDGNGLAVLRFTPKQEGTHVIKASFAGNSVFAPIEASSPLTINAGPETYAESRPFRMPGANITMVATVLTLVWGTFFFVILHFWKISQEKTAKKLEGESRQ